LTTLVRITAGSWEVSAGKQAVKESPLADSFHATVEMILVLMLIVFAVALLARWARLPYTIALVVTGLLGFQPGFRDLQLTPDLILIVSCRSCSSKAPIMSRRGACGATCCR
jgi:hypothetical protein